MDAEKLVSGNYLCGLYYLWVLLFPGNLYTEHLYSIRNIQFTVRRMWILGNLYLGTIYVDSTISGSFSTLATSTLNTSILSVVIVCQVRDTMRIIRIQLRLIVLY